MPDTKACGVKLPGTIHDAKMSPTEIDVTVRLLLEK